MFDCSLRSFSTIMVTRLGKSTVRSSRALVRLGRVTDQQVDLGRAHEPRVLPDVSRPVLDADVRERDVEQLADRCVSPVATT